MSQRIKKLALKNACHAANWIQFEKQCKEVKPPVKPNRKKFMRDYGIETSGKNLKRWLALFTDPETIIIDDTTGEEVTFSFDEFDSCCMLDMYVLGENGIGERSLKMSEYERDEKGSPVEKNPDIKPIELDEPTLPVETVEVETPVELDEPTLPVELDEPTLPVELSVNDYDVGSDSIDVGSHEVLVDLTDGEVEESIKSDGTVLADGFSFTLVDTEPTIINFSDDCEYEGAEFIVNTITVSSVDDIKAEKIMFSGDQSNITMIHDSTTSVSVNSEENPDLYRTVVEKLTQSMLTQNKDLALEAWKLVDTKSVVGDITYGRVTIKGDTVLYDGVKVTGTFESYLIEAAHGQDRPKAIRWMKFVDKVLQVHNEEIMHDLAAFVMKDGLELADDGDILAYKGYRSNGWDVWTGKTFYHKQGVLLKMPSIECNHNRECGAGAGVHFANKSRAESFGDGPVNTCKVKVDPRSIVAIPGFYGNGPDYGRCSRLQIIESPIK